MADSLRYMKVEPRKDQIQKQYKYPDLPDVTVPDMVGMSVQEIYEDIRSDLVLAKSGAGSTVISQLPAAGTRLPQGSTVRIYLSDPPEEKKGN
ncbi:Stage V sporulation protein D [compost metagenome]